MEVHPLKNLAVNKLLSESQFLLVCFLGFTLLVQNIPPFLLHFLPVVYFLSLFNL